ncbi:pheromone A receptor-domain-containing protein [Russula vinacea]|nr:pheromone A receptor-domain-containing protein [Russula vinacea]
MSPAPNQLYSAFSFIGFVLCTIPFYWHLEAWNTGTCLYMIWTGVGCLMQCINSIVWNGNIINRVPVYCDISTRIQVGLNVAIPACSLCINRRLYKIASVKAVMITREEKRRAVIQDLLICVGIPLLQMISRCNPEYIVSSNRYDILEDFGPAFAIVNTPLTYAFFTTWPVIIGLISLSYCVRTTYVFYKRQRQFNELMLASPGLSRGRYIRLMAIGPSRFLGPSRWGQRCESWKGWAYTHSNYSEVIQVAGFIWKNDPNVAHPTEIYRWSLVACAFIFFALFGFADEARLCYRRVYTSLASRIGYSTFTLHGSSHGNSSMPYLRSKNGVIVSVVTTGNKRRSSVSSIDQPSTIPTISIASDIKDEFKIEYSHTNSATSSYVENFELKMERQSTLSMGIVPTDSSASVPPHFCDTDPNDYSPTLRAEAI